jgi:hypothetical protein
MFRAVPCSPSGGKIVLLQPLVPSVNGRYKNILCKRPYSMPVENVLSPHTVRPFTESDDTRGCNNTICPPEDEQGTARNMLRIVM